MLRKLFIFILVLMLTACSFVDKERIREAKLIPRDIAIKTVERFTPMGFSTNPALPRVNSLLPVCSDKTPKLVRFEDLSLLTGDNQITVFTPYDGDIICGRSLSAIFKVPNQNDREDLFDALVALGAKPALVKK